MIISFLNVSLDGLKILPDLKILWQLAFRRAKFCEILSHSVRYGINVKQICRYPNFCLFVCFVALHPKSTSMVMAGRSIHLSTFFLGKRLTST